MKLEPMSPEEIAAALSSSSLLALNHQHVLEFVRAIEEFKARQLEALLATENPVIATLHCRDGENDTRFDTIIKRRDLCYEGIKLYALPPRLTKES